MTIYSPAMELDLLDIPEKPVSPYGVPAASVQMVPTTGPLMPFEERQLQNLIQQVQASPPRIKAAFFASISKE